MTFREISFVLPKKIAKDCGVRRILGNDFPSAVNETMGLVEVHRLNDVGGNQPIILKGFCDAIDLYCQCNWDACPF